MEIQIFSNSKFGQLRVALNEKGETVFCLADVCKALDIDNPSDVKRRLDSSSIDTIEVCLTSVNQYGAKSSESGGKTDGTSLIAIARQ